MILIGAYVVTAASLTYLGIVLWRVYIRPRLETHEHRCRQCGSSWRHSDACIGSVKDHTCKKCGLETWVRYG